MYLKAGLGQLGQQMGVQDINTLLGIGGLQQQQGQKELDVARANVLAEQALPFQQVGFMSDILEVFHHYNKQLLNTTPGPSRGSQMLGWDRGSWSNRISGGFGNFFNFGRPT